MRFRHLVQTCAALALAVTLSSPALAQGRDDRPEWQGDQPHYDHDRVREDWLADCRRRVSDRRGEDRGVGGAVIGGVAGGVIGNRIAGRGNRTVGTIAGAAVGAIAGAAIDKAEDRGRSRDECEAYLDDYYARYNGGGYAQPGYGEGYYDQPSYRGHPAYGYGYAAPMMMVPVMVQPQKPCVETVTTTQYVTRPARRTIRRAPRPDKRIRIAPDKRVPLK